MIMRFACCLLACSVLSACLPDDVCDKGFSEKSGLCFADQSASTKDSSVSTDEDSGSSNDTDASSTAAPDYSHFGDACTTNAECKEPAPACLGPLGYCSRTQCMDDPSVCPPDFECMDISAASPDPSVTHICLKK